jgi:hypothetical protein
MIFVEYLHELQAEPRRIRIDAGAMAHAGERERDLIDWLLRRRLPVFADGDRLRYYLEDHCASTRMRAAAAPLWHSYQRRLRAKKPQRAAA